MKRFYCKVQYIPGSTAIIAPSFVNQTDNRQRMQLWNFGY